MLRPQESVGAARPAWFWAIACTLTTCSAPPSKVTTKPPPTSGSVLLQWTFTDGSSCATLGDSISGIHVVAHGPEDIDDMFTCTSPQTGLNQASLDELAGGAYTFTAQVLSASSNQVVYAGSGNFDVDGSKGVTSLEVNLALVQGSNSIQLQLSWSFATVSGGSEGCSAAGVDAIQLQVGNGAGVVLPCSIEGVQGSLVQNLQAGTESIQVAGLVGPNQVVAFSAATTVILGNQQVTPLEVVLQPTTGQLELDYTFGGVGCLAAGVSQLGVTAIEILKDGGAGRDLTGFAPDTTFGCADPGVLRWKFFPALPFTLTVLGEDDQGTALWGTTRRSGVDAGVDNSVRVSLMRCTEEPQDCPSIQ